MILSLLIRSKAYLLVILITALVAAVNAKEWQTVDGNSVSGDYVSSQNGTILIKTINGREVELKRDRLIESDKTFLKLLEQYRSEIGIYTWPSKVRTRNEVRLRGGPTTYHTEHFQIHSGGMQRFHVSRLATVMEDTLDAISTLPTGLELRPPAPSTYFQARFMDRASFDREFAKVGMHLITPNQLIKGAYIAEKRELWLPTEAANVDLEMLGATIIHEVCHQTMHEWLPLLPIWFLEGFAEYMSSIPYENRIFRFDKCDTGLRYSLKSRYRTSPSSINVIHPRKMIENGGKWSNTSMEYASALIMVYYLIHLDGNGNGDAFNRLVSEVAKSKSDARNMLADLQNIANGYNSKVANYRQQWADYQKKINAANQQLRSGKRVFVRSKSNGRMVIAGSPAVPRAPQAPGEAPIQQINAERERTFDLISQVNQRAINSMLRGRSGDEFAKQLKQAYFKRGFIVNFY